VNWVQDPELTICQQKTKFRNAQNETIDLVYLLIELPVFRLSANVPAAFSQRRVAPRADPAIGLPVSSPGKQQARDRLLAGMPCFCRAVSYVPIQRRGLPVSFGGETRS
jgi:hypothetical protein